LVEASQELFWECDAEGRYTYLNAAWEDAFGYRLDEMLGRPFTDFQDPEAAERDTREFSRLMAGGSVRGYDTVHIRKNGQPIYLSFTARHYFDDQGRIVGTVGTAHDITANKRSELELRQSEARFKSIVESSPLGIHMYELQADDRLVFTGANPAADRILGVDNSIFVGRTIEDAFPPLIETEVPQRYRAAARDGAVWTTEQIDYDHSGIRGAFEVVAFQISPGRMAALFFDITTRKRAEARLAEERERLAVTLHSIADGVITTNTAGRIVVMNRVAADLTDCSKANAVGCPLEEVFCVVDALTREPLDNIAEAVLASGSTVELGADSALLSRLGTERLVTTIGSPIRDDEGAVVGVVIVFRDVTEKVKWANAVHRVQHLESLGVLAGGIAHDFNNLLGGIFGYMELARDCCVNQDTAHYIGEALQTIGRARGLTQQLLTFAKGGAPVREKASLFPLVRETVLFALSGTTVKCEFRIPDDLWFCEYDLNQVSQVIDNIAINAKQAMPLGGTLTVAAANVALGSNDHGTLPAGRYVRISLSDTGVGISRKVKDRIFDPFFTTKQSGSGLGLAVAHSVVTRHGGSIDVDSEPERGTTMHLLLPATDRPELSGSPTTETTPLRRGRVLLLDDEEVILDTASRMLQRLGLEVVCTRDGHDTLARFFEARQAGRPFDVVLVALTVRGGLGGIDVLRELRGTDQQVPVFVSSGYADNQVVADPLVHGFSGSIRKPYTLAELAALLRQE
jgi:PAS domain S-box-containing protein